MQAYVEQIHNKDSKQEKQLVVLKVILNCQLFLYLEKSANPEECPPSAT
jgi:hypothetical protein